MENEGTVNMIFTSLSKDSQKNGFWQMIQVTKLWICTIKMCIVPDLVGPY